MNDSLLEQLNEKKKEIDQFILDFLPKKDKVKEINDFYEMIRDYPSRPSKGLRSSLCILTCEAFGGNDEEAFRTAAALEIFQNWILIHDDVEDASEMRRGDLVLHRKYSAPLAINVGDALHGKMWEILVSNTEMLGPSRTLSVIKEFITMINQTTEGQHMELSWVTNNNWNISEQDYYLMCNKKTSWYTCISPCRLGGIIAGTNSKNLSQIISFGSNLGKAFQIQDDILNLTSDELKYGKESSGDIFEGKRTLILIHLIDNANPIEKEKILEIMSKNRENRTRPDVNYILNLIEKYESIDYAKSKANDLTFQAKKGFQEIFATFPKTRSKILLEELIDFMVDRNW